MVIRSLGLGGAERLLVLLATRLRDNGWEPVVIAFYGGRLEEELQAAGIAVEHLRKRGRWDFLVIVRLARTIRRLDPDITYAWLPMSNLLCILVKPFIGRSSVVTSIHMARRGLRELSLVSKLSHWLNIRTVRWSDRVIVNSGDGVEEMRSVGRVPSEKLALVPNGVDIGHFTRDDIGRSQLRDEWSVAPAEFLYGLVTTRLELFKGHEVFLRAAAEALSDLPEAVFVCFGDGSRARREELRHLAAGLGISARVQWVGVRQDVRAVYSALDTLVVASYSEGGPNVVIEAMACGVPCAVTDVGYAKEMVGDTGLCVAVGDHHALAGAMVDLARRSGTDIDRVRSACRDRAVQEFSAQAYVARTIAALEPVGRP
jgi:glycosyltransferase involved in cell wall biosynthesis